MGAGMSSTTLSSIACTPLFLKAEPHIIGTISEAMVRVRSPNKMSDSDNSPSSRYLFIKSSLASAAASTILERHLSQSAFKSAGISR